MKVAEQIRLKLTAAFAPLRLDIIDESHRHEGHSGSRPSGETHFRVEIVSSGFEGRSRVERQRLVYAALAAEMNNPIHALSIGAYTPGEATPTGTRKN